MARLIDAKDLSVSIFATKCSLCNGGSEWLNGYRDALQAVLELIEEAPTVDAVPVVHGGWIQIRDKFGNCIGMKCNNCGRRVRNLGENFCPNCGAYMRGDGDG